MRESRKYLYFQRHIRLINKLPRSIAYYRQIVVHSNSFAKNFRLSVGALTASVNSKRLMTNLFRS